MRHFGGFLFLALVFLLGAWLGGKYPKLNLIGKVA